MSDGFWMALFQFLGLVATAYIAYRQKTISQHVEKIEKSTNSMMAERLVEVGEAQYAKGVKSEVDKK